MLSVSRVRASVKVAVKGLRGVSTSLPSLQGTSYIDRYGGCERLTSSTDKRNRTINTYNSRNHLHMFRSKSSSAQYEHLSHGLKA